jgi:hypothetical protein
MRVTSGPGYYIDLMYCLIAHKSCCRVQQLNSRKSTSPRPMTAPNDKLHSLLDAYLIKEISLLDSHRSIQLLHPDKYQPRTSFSHVFFFFFPFTVFPLSICVPDTVFILLAPPLFSLSGTTPLLSCPRAAQKPLLVSITLFRGFCCCCCCCGLCIKSGKCCSSFRKGSCAVAQRDDEVFSVFFGMVGRGAE